MSNENKESDEVTGTDKAWLIGGAIFIGFMLLGFVRLMIVEGPTAAFDKAPGPALLFVIALVIGWFVLSAHLQDTGAKDTGKTMWNIGKVVLLLFFVSIILSKCGIDLGGVEDIRPPRSL
ncbi:MAG: hypothetical protein V3T17_11880 [Pseudomonadales bacterium]